MKHDAIVKQGTNRDKIVYSQLSNIKEKRGDAEKLMAPTADEAALTAERTRQAFEKVHQSSPPLEKERETKTIILRFMYVYIYILVSVLK